MLMCGFCIFISRGPLGVEPFDKTLCAVSLALAIISRVGAKK